MNEAGLPEKWRSRFRKGNGRCTGKKEKKKPQSRHHQSANHRITLQNLSGSFVVLLVGISFSIAVFIIELILRRRNNNSRVVHIQPPPVAAPAVVNKSSPPAVKQNDPVRVARRRINNPKNSKIQPLLIRPVIRPAVVNNLPQGKDTQQVPVVSNQPGAPMAAPVAIPSRINVDAAINVLKDLPPPKEVVTVTPTSSIIAAAVVVENRPVEAANKGQTVVVIHPPAVKDTKKEVIAVSPNQNEARSEPDNESSNYAIAASSSNNGNKSDFKEKQINAPKVKK